MRTTCAGSNKSRNESRNQFCNDTRTDATAFDGSPNVRTDAP